MEVSQGCSCNRHKSEAGDHVGSVNLDYMMPDSAEAEAQSMHCHQLMSILRSCTVQSVHNLICK